MKCKNYKGNRCSNWSNPSKVSSLMTLFSVFLSTCHMYLQVTWSGLALEVQVNWKLLCSRSWPDGAAVISNRGSSTCISNITWFISCYNSQTIMAVDLLRKSALSHDLRVRVHAVSWLHCGILLPWWSQSVVPHARPCQESPSLDVWCQFNSFSTFLVKSKPNRTEIELFCRLSILLKMVVKIMTVFDGPGMHCRRLPEHYRALRSDDK